MTAYTRPIKGEFLCKSCMRWKPEKSRDAIRPKVCGGCGIAARANLKKSQSKS